MNFASLRETYSATEFTDQLLEKINSIRVKNRLTPLTINKNLQTLAMQNTHLMVKKNKIVKPGNHIIKKYHSIAFIVLKTGNIDTILKSRYIKNKRISRLGIAAADAGNGNFWISIFF